jgi:hypothetical protein
MGDQPTIANLLAQIAISGSPTNGAAAAPEQKTIHDLVRLGLSERDVTELVERAIQLGLVERRTGEYLAIAQ